MAAGVAGAIVATLAILTALTIAAPPPPETSTPETSAVLSPPAAAQEMNGVAGRGAASSASGEPVVEEPRNAVVDAAQQTGSSGPGGSRLAVMVREGAPRVSAAPPVFVVPTSFPGPAASGRPAEAPATLRPPDVAGAFRRPEARVSGIRSSWVRPHLLPPAAPTPRPERSAAVEGENPGLALDPDRGSRSAAFGDAWIVVHHAAPFDETARMAAQRLREAGAMDVRLKPVSATVSTLQARYFRAQDEAAALAALDALKTSGAAARDFTEFTPSPEAGLIELWLAAPE